jgi:hypothetical protein
MDEVFRHSGQPIGLILRPAIFDQNITAVDETGFAQPQAKCRHKIGSRLERATMEKPDHRHRRLLRPRRERPSGSCTAKERNELTAFHA